jgi:hypothetical protein
MPLPLLTGPTKKAASKTTIMAELAGHTEEVDQLIAAKEQIESLEAEVEILRGNLEPLAAEARVAKEIETGRCVKSVLLEGTERPVRLSWKDSFRTIASQYEGVLREHLGKDFDAILKREVTVSMRKGTTEAALKAALGDKYETLLQFADVTDAITVLPSAMERRGALRAGMTATANAALDEIFKQAQHSPALSTK